MKYQNDYDAQQGIGQLIGGSAAALSFLWIIVQLRLQYDQLVNQEKELAEQRASIETMNTLHRTQAVLQLRPQVMRVLDKISRSIVRDLASIGVKFDDVNHHSHSEYPFISILDRVSQLDEAMLRAKGTPVWRSIEAEIAMYLEQYDALIAFEDTLNEKDRVLDDLLKNSAEHHLYCIFKALLNS